MGGSEDKVKKTKERTGEASSSPVAVREGKGSRPMHASHLGNQADGGVILEGRDPERTVGEGG